MLSGLVIFSHRLSSLGDFYQHVFDMHVKHLANDHIVLQNTYMELVVHGIGEEAKLQDACPNKRQHVALKPVFMLPFSLPVAVDRINQSGGQINIEHSWRWGEYQVCDGVDCEGNVFQIRSLFG